jgi:hypothetical protein
MTTQAIMDHYNKLHADAHARFATLATDGLIHGTAHYGYKPSDFDQVQSQIEAAICAEYPRAMADELQQAAVEGRFAKAWERGCGCSCDAWVRNDNRGGKLAVTYAQPAIQKILDDSAKVRKDRYEHYRKAVEQGVALPPPSPPAKKCICTTPS